MYMQWGSIQRQIQQVVALLRCQPAGITLIKIVWAIYRERTFIKNDYTQAISSARILKLFFHVISLFSHFIETRDETIEFFPTIYCGFWRGCPIIFISLYGFCSSFCENRQQGVSHSFCFVINYGVGFAGGTMQTALFYWILVIRDVWKLGKSASRYMVQRPPHQVLESIEARKVWWSSVFILVWLSSSVSFHVLMNFHLIWCFVKIYCLLFSGSSELNLLHWSKYGIVTAPDKFNPRKSLRNPTYVSYLVVRLIRRGRSPYIRFVCRRRYTVCVPLVCIYARMCITHPSTNSSSKIMRGCR